MHAGIYPEIDRDFGNWLAGFTDGEGSFAITRSVRPTATQTYFGCIIALGLRDDDRAILEEIMARTGCGRIYNQKRIEEGSKPRAVWKVFSRADCMRMVQVFDQFPLRAKKARDFTVWREGVAVWTRTRRGPGTIRGNGIAWEQMAVLKRRLESGRAYPDHLCSLLEVAVVDPVSDQLEFAVEEGVHLADMPPVPLGEN